MKLPFRLILLGLFVILISACQPRIQPIYVPSSVALPAGLETAPLSVIRDGILEAGAAKSWKMKEVEPGVIRGTLNVRNKHQAVVDVVYTNQSFAINYVSSRNLLSQGARIHRSYNIWVRQLETSIYNYLGYAAKAHKNDPAASGPTAVIPSTKAFDPAGIWNVSATYSPAAVTASFCPKQRNWYFELDYRKRGGISETYWSDGVQLNVTGEHSEDYSDLVFAVPGGGDDWQLTEQLNLDKPQVRLTSKAKSSASSTNSISSCIGVIDIIMKQQDRSVTARAPAPSVAITPAPKPASPPVTTSATAADIAWRNLKDKQDPAELSLFLKEHLDSKYAAVAIQNLNAALVISDSAAARNSARKNYNTAGRWRVSARYESGFGKAAYCAKQHAWDFDLTLSDTPQSYTFWTGSEGLYVNSTIENGRLVLALNYPRGGSNWQWSERFRLDQDQQNFLSEAQGAGGGHAGCVGKLLMTMKRIK